MPVITRGQANQLQEEEFALLRKIETDYTYEDPFIITTRSATGCGIHRRWIYSDTPLPTPANKDIETQPANQTLGASPQSQPQPTQVRRSWSRGSLSEGNTSEDDGNYTPESTPPATPSPPKPTGRASSSRVIADTDMTFLLRIKKDEDVKEALTRHVELYAKESEIRKRENQRRVYEFVKSRPHLLREVNEDTELIVREDSGWDHDPFL